ncbi:MAG: nucleotidyltransferase family protein [Anaerolineae bacterium]
MSSHLILARELAASFSAFPHVEAVAVGGSLASGAADAGSDIDLYVYTTSVIPLPAREALVAQRGFSRADLNLQFWDLGDEWVDEPTGIEVDVIYWDTAWIAEQIDRVLVHHQASVGYTTCFWNTVRNSVPLYDRQGWFAHLQARCQMPYPEPLRRAIVAKNYPILRDVIPAYLHQIQHAVRRHDAVSVNHRVAALLASYFDVLFAVNAVLRPGEKRLLEIATERCTKRPPAMREQVEAVLRAAADVDADETLVHAIDHLIDDLDVILLQEGFDLG